ncbi:MAG TPA: HNH endonuclease, partial [Oscillospiraceae bacterium]|nr:HNH endonuclease [Oscillospiraceae bacterium]
MLKACAYCGGIHPKGEKCPKRKPIDYIKKDEAYDFRNSSAWQNKREEIKDRDLHLCQACLNLLPGTIKQYNSDELEVHHIQKLREH